MIALPAVFLAIAAIGPAGAAVPAHDAAAPSELVEGERLLGAIAALPQKRSATGTEEHRAGLKKSEGLLVAALIELGYEPQQHRIHWDIPRRGEQQEGEEGDPAGPMEWFNITADLRGTETPGEVLIISAHFDAVPASPGADDDGTGVAAVLEMARILKDRPMKRTVRWCLFNLEEVGMVGSSEYVNTVIGPRTQGGEERIVGMVSMDMLGYFSDEPNSQKSPFENAEAVERMGLEVPTVGDFIGMGGVLRHRQFSQRFAHEMRAASPELNVVVVDFLPVAPPDMLRSDHAPFLAMGLPAVILSDTANFRSPHYHRPTDTIDTIDAERFLQTVQGVIGAVYAIAEPANDDAANANDEHVRPDPAELSP